MKILVVDDDRVLADLVAFTLQREGWEVIQAHDGQGALRRWQEEQPDLLVLDVNLPDLDGFTICRRIREQSDVPVILLTVRGDDDDIVYGLQIGADDYVAKPFSRRQLAARIQAVLRRAYPTVQPGVRVVGEVTFDASRWQVRIGNGEPIALSELEARLLDYLLLHAGHVLTYAAIIDYVYGSEGGTRTMVRQLVYRLRGRIESDPSNPRYILTVSGIGYEWHMRPDLDNA